MAKPPVDTHFFKVDPAEQVILGLATKTASLPHLKIQSVTTDQPQYWPHESVFLKLFFPINPGAPVTVTLSRSQASAMPSIKVSLNEGGALVLRLMDGSTSPLETGEWKVTVKADDGSFEDHADFAVSAGALSPVSLAHPFTPVTRGEEFEKLPGAVFMANEGGVGHRWGNGLNLKNELRIHGIPYQGEARLISRCFLPGCNGVAAGEPVSLMVDKGKFQATLGVGGHSGPYGVEIITPDGSLTHVFSHTSHVERQPIPLSGFLKENHIATLAPYQGAAEVTGRGLFLANQGDNPKAVFSVPRMSGAPGTTLSVQALKSLKGIKVVSYRCASNGRFEPTLEKAPETLKAKDSLPVLLSGPYTLFAVAGFDGDRYHEAWFLGVTESPLELRLSAPPQGIPLTEVSVSLTSIDRFTGKGISRWGILEVFDTRVESRSPRDPLLSSLGDHARNTGNLLASWQDTSGLFPVERRDRVEEKSSLNGFKGGSKSVGAVAPPRSLPPPPTPPMASPSVGSPGPMTSAVAAPPASQTPTRVGEKKVVACLLIQTDEQGRASAKVTLPPQTGRLELRYVAVGGVDTALGQGAVDVSQDNLLETTAPAHFLPGNRVTLMVRVASKSDLLTLSAGGTAVNDPFSVPVPAGGGMVPLEIVSAKGGELDLTLRDDSGRILDRRLFPLQDPHRSPVTFSELTMGTGKPLVIPAGARLAVYPTPAALLNEAAQTVQVTLQSWFGTSESLAAQAAVRAVLLRAMGECQLPSGGLDIAYRLALARNLKELQEAYWDPATGQFRNYPGLPASGNATTRVVGHLSRVREHLRAAKDTTLKEILKPFEPWLESLPKPRVEDLVGDELPVQLGKDVVFRTVVDPGVVPWFLENALPFYRKTEASETGTFRMLLDKFRFLRSFERTGEAHYLLQNARALQRQKDPAFGEVFARLAKNLILVQEPGLLQGPALSGGVYASPGILVPFLELLFEMASHAAAAEGSTVAVQGPTGTDTFPLPSDVLALPMSKTSVTVTAPKFSILRIDRTQVVDPWKLEGMKPFFKVDAAPVSLAIGGQGILRLTLAPDRDPAEYAAYLLLPSHLALKLTADNLSDARGGRLVGQGQTGGQKIQVARVPFRGSRDMSLILEGLWRGEGDGAIVVRHLGREEDRCILPLQQWTVK